MSTNEKTENNKTTVKRFNCAQAMFQAARKKQRVETAEPETSKSVDVKSEVSEDDSALELRRKAAEALMRESQRGAERAKTMGAQGWIKPTSLSTNKNFLKRTLESTKISRRKDRESK
ncbi:hypothetical protein M3Y98_00202400 [Aphelenchoides besseyi]|nr:hypothetical protein M3Y98_00202400 [Aphelenchoides besseyi]KAI6200311.1 hypothetical protein M3Y96_00720100 [Aphelenchoides besseyi]